MTSAPAPWARANVAALLRSAERKESGTAAARPALAKNSATGNIVPDADRASLIASGARCPSPFRVTGSRATLGYCGQAANLRAKESLKPATRRRKERGSPLHRIRTPARRLQTHRETPLAVGGGKRMIARLRLRHFKISFSVLSSSHLVREAN